MANPPQSSMTKRFVVGLILAVQLLGVVWVVFSPSKLEPHEHSGGVAAIQRESGKQQRDPTARVTTEGDLQVDPSAPQADPAQREQRSDGGTTAERDVDRSLFAPGKHQMPTVGLGTAALGPKVEKVVLAGLEMGYRHIDTALAREWYRDDLVGAAVKKSGINRHKLFITTKLHPRDLGTEPTRTKIREALDNLQTTYINLFMLHYPQCYGMCKSPPKGTWKDSWRAMEEAVRNGTVQYIGVSNFGVAELKELWSFADIKPYAVQTHSDPLSPNKNIQEFCAAHDVKFVAYSSLGTQHEMRSSNHTNPVLTSSVIHDIATRNKVPSPALVVLSWAIHNKQHVIPRTANVTHMRQNLDADRIALSATDYAAIDKMAT